MKLTNTFLIPALCWTTRLAAAGPAHVYIHDPESQPRTEPHSRSLEPIPARLVLAQRAGVEDYHSSDLSRDEVIDAINDYGRRTPLFASADNNVKNAIILLEAQHISQDYAPSFHHDNSFELSPVPAAPVSRLFVDLAKQADPHSFSHLSEEDVFEFLKDSRTLLRSGDKFYVAQSTEDFEAVFTRLAETRKWSVTAIVIPSSQTPTTEQEQSQWGAYEVPGLQAPLRKRQQTKEAPLTKPHLFDPAPSASSPVHASANNTAPLRGILPACFASQSACEKATRGCTGHGTCKLKYHDSTSGGDGGYDCFACSCSSPGTGGSTTKWGGPACQKKDISVQFWLIALFSIGMVFLVSFAVGTIWEMGSQELPSVIGAGVSGPTARK